MKAIKTSLTLCLLIPNMVCAADSQALQKGKAQFAKGNFAAAAVEFFKEDKKDLLAGRLGLGITLNKLKMPHLASIPLMTVATQGSGKQQKKAFDSLVRISFDTNDNTLLNYSVNKLTVENLEDTSQEIYYNRLAEYYHELGKYDESLQNLELVLKKNPNNEKALHLSGLIYLKKDKPEKAAEYFKYIMSFWDKKSPTNEIRGAALTNYARTLYQARKLSEAESIYRQIPKDHVLYRKVQMELAWTLFRNGKIRSAMSALQTLHTPYYENFYDPESFILRSIILIFACQGDEAMKSILSFEKNFAGLDTALTHWQETKPDTGVVINELQLAQKRLKDLSLDKKGTLPFFVVRSIMDEQPLSGLLKVKRDIAKEQTQFQKTFKQVEKSNFYTYAQKAYQAKTRNINKNIARVFNNKVLLFQKEFRDFETQVDFLKYEILEEQKRASKARIIDEKKLDDEEKRSFYIQNGYRYWPFTGEYWIDEIGNYQYLGVNRCEE